MLEDKNNRKLPAFVDVSMFSIPLINFYVQVCIKLKYKVACCKDVKNNEYNLPLCQGVTFTDICTLCLCFAIFVLHGNWSYCCLR